MSLKAMTPFEKILSRGFGEPVRIVDATREELIALESQMVANIDKVDGRSAEAEAWSDAELVSRAAFSAREAQLEIEWTITFLHEIRAGATAQDAVNAADKEWDL